MKAIEARAPPTTEIIAAAQKGRHIASQVGHSPLPGIRPAISCIRVLVLGALRGLILDRMNPPEKTNTIVSCRYCAACKRNGGNRQRPYVLIRLTFPDR